MFFLLFLYLLSFVDDVSAVPANVCELHNSANACQSESPDCCFLTSSLLNICTNKAGEKGRTSKKT